MARTSKKAKAVAVATVEKTATAAKISSIADVLANVSAVPPASEAIAARGETVFIPLDKLKKSQRNARKTPLSIGSEWGPWIGVQTGPLFVARR